MEAAHLSRVCALPLPTSPLPRSTRRHRFIIIRSPDICVNLPRTAAAAVSNGGGSAGGDSSSSYLDMWRNAMERERQEQEFLRISQNAPPEEAEAEEEEGPEAGEKRTLMFERLLEVPKEERDRVQRLQVIDRAAAAIAAARALFNEIPKPDKEDGIGASGSEAAGELGTGSSPSQPAQQGTSSGQSFVSQSGNSTYEAPGPDFWSWSPPPETKTNSINNKLDPSANPLLEKERSVDFLAIPFERTFIETHNAPLPPLQSLMEVSKGDSVTPMPEHPLLAEEHELEVLFASHAEEAAEALHNDDEKLSAGVKPDGSRWWRETGTERRPNGVVCKWTLTRGVSENGEVEWQEKFWEAADKFDYKELGSEKSGRDAAGNVWHEYWKESMWQDLKSGLVHMEKTADKWGKNGRGDEWQEQWFEHYDASGQAEKWAHKWCSIDPKTIVEAGHAHVWHERWGEKYDGFGGSMKYTDKWAERLEGDEWVKWGDKWDEHFDSNGHGVKQGEAWWEGKYGERWNRTWGEGHNGSGWVHKYGKSSSGEHWDTHVQQDTWYERYPHYGFELCFKNSVQLREVNKPPETS